MCALLHAAFSLLRLAFLAIKVAFSGPTCCKIHTPFIAFAFRSHTGQVFEEKKNVFPLVACFEGHAFACPLNGATKAMNVPYLGNF